MSFFDGGFGGIIGGIGSIIGGSMAANATRDAARSQIRAAEDNRDFDQTNLNQGMARQLAMLLGGDRAYQMLAGTMGQDQLRQLFRNPDAAARLTALNSQLSDVDANLQKYGRGGRWVKQRSGNGLVNRQVWKPATYDKKRARADGVDIDALLRTKNDLTATIENDAKAIPQDALDLGEYKKIGGSLSGYDTLARDAEQQGRDAMDQYDQATNTLSRDMDASLGETQRFGDKRRELINRNMDDARTGNNRLIQSSLLARGLGNSTVLGNQLTGATEQLENARQQQLASIDDAQIGMMNQLRGDRTSLLNNRLTGRTQMMLGNQDRVLGYRAQPINLQTQLLSSGMTNPWAGRSTQQYFPGLNPGAMAQASWANTIGNMSGMMLGNYLRSPGGSPSGAGAGAGAGGGGGWNGRLFNPSSAGGGLPTTPRGPLG
jgi:hypothetical protein